jgi:hypothetical protein
MNQLLSLGSFRGTLYVKSAQLNLYVSRNPRRAHPRWGYKSSGASQVSDSYLRGFGRCDNAIHGAYDYEVLGLDKCNVLGVPHWLAVVLTAAIAASVWIRWRFSLRTLLIVMTLVAVGLGAIVCAVG